MIFGRKTIREMALTDRTGTLIGISFRSKVFLKAIAQNVASAELEQPSLFVTSQ